MPEPDPPRPIAAAASLPIAAAEISARAPASIPHATAPSNRACDVRVALNPSGPTGRIIQ